MFRFSRVALSGLLLFVSSAQQVAAQSSVPRRGTVIRVDTLGLMDRARLAATIDFLPEKIAVPRDVDLYRIVYWTVLRDRPVKASGLLVLPKDQPAVRGVVAFLHGTNVTSALAPSQPGRVDGNEEAAVFGSNGYMVVLPDYIGLGESTDRQQYMLAQPTVDATLDMLRASKRVAERLRVRWNPALMLMGFSQGGYSVATVQRALEQRPLAGYQLRGSVAVAGAYALRGVSLPYAMQKNNFGYVAFMVAAYAFDQGIPLDSAFLPKVAERLPELLDGTHQMADFAPWMMRGFPGIFRADFLRAIQENRSNWFTEALDANSVNAWVPRTPIRLYNGTKDNAVSPEDATGFYEYSRARGGAVTRHSLGDIEHLESVAHAFPLTLRWFDSLSVRGKRR
jgi:Secretory lipase